MSLVAKTAILSAVLAACYAAGYALEGAVFVGGLAGGLGMASGCRFVCARLRGADDEDAIVNQDLVRQIASLTRGAIVETDAALRVVRVLDRSGNPVLAPLSEWEGLSLADAQTGAAEERNRVVFDAVQGRQTMRNADWYLPQADGGEPARLRINAWPLLRGDGQFRGYVLQIRPYVERSQIDEAIVQSERALRSLIDNFPGAVCLKDRDGEFLLTNDHYDRISRASSARQREKTEAVYSDLEAKVIEGGEPVESDVIIGERTYTLLLFPILAADGSTYAVGSLTWDITERRREQRELAQSSDRLRRFVENLPAGAALIEANGDVRINMALEALTGYSRDRLRRLGDWFPLAYRENAAKAEARYREIREKREVRNQSSLIR